MEKLIKKLGIVTFILILTQAILPVMAQPNLSGIDPNQEGSITINRFAGGTAASPTTGTPLNGIPYTIELVRFRDGIEATPANLRNPANFDPIPAPNGFSQTESTVNGIASFTNLPQGIFRVTEGTHTVTPEADRVAPFIVGIPRLSEDGETWIYNVDVYPKTEEDTIIDFEKELELAWDPILGEMVATWTLEATIPRLIGNATRLEFVDELDDRLTLVPGSVVGTYLRMEEVDDVPVTTTATLPSTAFTATVDANNVLSIALTTAGFDHLATYAILAPEGTLTFTFRTTVSAEEEADFGALTNDATLYYNEEEVTVIVPPTDTLFGLEIEKVDVNRERINGAVFELFRDAAGNIPAFPDDDGYNLQFSATSGLVLIPNLLAGTFYLQEVVTPVGFRPITNSMQVIIGESSVDTGRNYVVAVQVVNEVEDGFNLPETGGVGTILFTVFGLALIGGAITLTLILRRRRKRVN